MDALLTLPLEKLGLVGFSMLIGWLALTGRIISPRQHERELAARDKQIELAAERNQYLETTMTAMQETKAEVIRQNGELLGAAQLANRLLEAGRVGTGVGEG